jgi:hypothetical protein
MQRDDITERARGKSVLSDDKNMICNNAYDGVEVSEMYNQNRE